MTDCTSLRYFSWIVFFQKQRQMQDASSGNKTYLRHSDLRGGAFLEELLCRTSYSKDFIQRQKEQDTYKSETWNVNTLNQAGNFENLKKETQRNAVSVLGVCEERLKKKVFCSCYIVYVLGIAFRDSLCETEKCRRPTRAFCFSLRPIEMASYRKRIHSPKIIGPVVKTHSLWNYTGVLYHTLVSHTYLFALLPIAPSMVQQNAERLERFFPHVTVCRL